MVPSGSTFERILTEQLGLKPGVVNNAIEILSDMVTKGVGEKVHAKGFFVVITNDVDERFLNRIVPNGREAYAFQYPAQLALPPRYNKHGGPTKLNVLGLTGAGKRFLQPDLVCTGGIMVIAQTGDIVASRAEANKGMRVAEGTYDGVGVSTLDDREAVGIAEQGRCVVLTCAPESCQIDGTSGGSMRMFFQGGVGGVEAKSPAGVRVVEVPTKAPATHLISGGVETAEAAHPHYEYDSITGNPVYMEEKLPVALQNEFKAETMGNFNFHTSNLSAECSSKSTCIIFCFVLVFPTYEYLAFFVFTQKNHAPALQIISRRA